MVRSLLLLVASLVLFSQSVNSLDCWVGIRLDVDHPFISYPPNPVYTTCPAGAGCCSVSWKLDIIPQYNYTCATDCPDFKGKESVTVYGEVVNTVTNKKAYVSHCVGPNNTCVYHKDIGFGCDRINYANCKASGKR